MPNSDRLRELVCVVEQGSISAASRALGIPRATLSRRLSEMEAELGVRLVHRSTRQLVLTPAGIELHRRARRVVGEIEAAWASVRALDARPRGPLRVSIPEPHPDYTSLFVQFAEDHPEVQLEVSADRRHVDLRAEGIDVAIRIGRVRDPSLVARRLWVTRATLVASKSYLERRGRPADTTELAEHDCITGVDRTAGTEVRWPLLEGGTVAVRPRLSLSSMVMRLAAVQRGLGIALVPEHVLAKDEARGLVPLLEGVVGSEVPVSLVFVDREFLPLRVRLFIDRAIAHLEAQRRVDRDA